MGVSLSVAALLSANAFAEDMKPCPEGCFCFKFGGKIASNYAPDCKAKATTLDCGYNGKHVWFFTHANGSGQQGKLTCVNEKLGPTDYNFDEFGELFWDGAYGIYGVSDKGDFVPMYSDKKYGWGLTNEYGVYSCPTSYPNSDKGAKTVKDCYKKDANGKKIYYIPSHTITLRTYDDATSVDTSYGIMTNSNDKKVWVSQGGGKPNAMMAGVYKRRFSGNNNNFSLPIITHGVPNSGKVFAGWCEDEKLTKNCNKNKNFTGYSVSSNKTYYAKWSKSLNVNGSLPKLQSSKDLKPVKPVKIKQVNTNTK